MGVRFPRDAYDTVDNASIFLSLLISKPPIDRRNLNLTNPNLVDVKLALLSSRY